MADHPGTDIQTMSVQEMSRLYSISDVTIYRALNSTGKNYLRGFKLGRNGKWLIRKADADDWMDRLVEQFERDRYGAA